MARTYRKRNPGNSGRVPASVNGVQVNFCRNLQCDNFRVIPLPAVGRGPNAKLRDDYRLVGRKRNTDITEGVPMRCMKCGQSFSMKSNLGAFEEFERQARPMLVHDRVSCRSPQCVNYRQSVHANPSGYQSFGRSNAGSKRYRCKNCEATFSVPVAATLRQRKPELGKTVLTLLFNKMPMRRICEAASIEPAVLYNRIDFIHRQCERFGAFREMPLHQGMRLDKLRIAVDRQDHTFNWASHADRRNTHLWGVGSADCTSGYVLGWGLDYDPDLNPYEVDLHAREIGDYELADPYRNYARLFLPGDYPRSGSNGVVEAAQLAAQTKLPSNGMRIHAEYVLLGHFLYLKWLLPGVERFHFYLDQEPGIRAAFISTFSDSIVTGQTDGFFVSVAKTMSVEEKKLSLAHKENMLARLQSEYSGLNRKQIAVEVMKARYLDACRGKANPLDRWVESVFAHMGEPNKRVLFVTDRGNENPENVATAMLEASLHPIDRYFMQVRRRISLLERPITTPSAAHRAWHGYSCYNPHVAQKILTSFRIIYNYCLVGRDGKTPAMRLGLAETPVTYDELLSFV